MGTQRADQSAEKNIGRSRSCAFATASRLLFAKEGGIARDTFGREVVNGYAARAVGSEP